MSETMTLPAVTHATFTVERTYPHPPAKGREEAVRGLLEVLAADLAR